jgi:hypothetical protein
VPSSTSSISTFCSSSICQRQTTSFSLAKHRRCEASARFASTCHCRIENLLEEVDKAPSVLCATQPRMGPTCRKIALRKSLGTLDHRYLIAHQISHTPSMPTRLKHSPLQRNEDSHMQRSIWPCKIGFSGSLLHHLSRYRLFRD